MLRTIVIILYLICFFLIGFPVAIAGKLLHWSDEEKRVAFYYSYVTLGLRMVGWLAGTSLTVIGQERVPKDTAVLYISNHRSIFDTVNIMPLLNKPSSMLAKIEMEKVPFLSWWMRAIRCQFLDRNDIKQGLKCILECISLIKKGESVCIFPEGTRSSGDEMGEFKEGSFKVAQKSGCLIVPVAITGTENILEEHFPAIRACPVTIEFGETVDMKTLSEDDRKHVGVYVQNIIAGMLKDHGNNETNI